MANTNIPLRYHYTGSTDDGFAEYASGDPMVLQGLLEGVTGANIASGSTVNLSTATGNLVHITGVTTITAFTMTSGQQMVCIADGAFQLTYNATTMKLNSGGANYTTAAGDVLLVFYDGTITTVRIIKQDGTAVVSMSSNGFTSQNVVTGSRAFGTVYQNTTGKTMFIVVTGLSSTAPSAMKAYTDSNSSPSTEVVDQNQSVISYFLNCSFMVLNNNYYKVTLTATATLNFWVEWY